MIKSPARNLSIKFLRSLIDNRFLSPRGKEYSESEVKEALVEKEMRQAERDFNRELREAGKNWQLMTATILEHQDRISKMKTVKDETASSVYAPSFSCADTIFQLPVKKDPALFDGHHKIKQQAGGLVGQSVSSRSHSIAQPQSSPLAYRRKGKSTVRIFGNVSAADQKRTTIMGMKVLAVREVTDESLARDRMASEKLSRTIESAMKTLAQNSLKKVRKSL